MVNGIIDDPDLKAQSTDLPNYPESSDSDWASPLPSSAQKKDMLGLQQNQSEHTGMDLKVSSFNQASLSDDFDKKDDLASNYKSPEENTLSFLDE